MKCIGMVVSERDWRLVSKVEDFIDSTEDTWKVAGVLLQSPPTHRSLKYGSGIQEHNLGYL